mmetsp:Transcript_7503/g.13494  ORF Transcript_7503/g.13494 Transcript_7503/m.13494 type:complete len:750 (-) Transcript_7503:189-2438(-)
MYGAGGRPGSGGQQPFPGMMQSSSMGGLPPFSYDHQSSLRGVGAQMMSSAGNPHAERLDRLEQEMLKLRDSNGMGGPGMGMPPQPSPLSMSGQQIMPANHFGGNMPMPMPLAQNGGMMQHGDALSQLMAAHTQLIQVMTKQGETHTELMQAHKELMNTHRQMLANGGFGGGAGKAGAPAKAKSKHPALGVIRLDYDYPPAEGDTDCPASFGYDVFYRVIPGLSFEMAQRGQFTEEVERRFADGIKFLEQRGVSAITGDCGFMMAFQVLARKIASKPVFMSSMVQCPAMACAFDPTEKMMVMTANGHSLKPQKEVLLSSCGFDVEEDRFVIVGCQDVPGFDAVAKGQEVPLDVVQPGIVKLCMETLRRHPQIKGILLECTELPPYADALRAATDLPVWDAITAADFYISGFKDNPRFGVNDWQQEFDEIQEEYHFGSNLVRTDQKLLENAGGTKGADLRKKKAIMSQNNPQVQKLKKHMKKKQFPSLGVVRLDYSYPPAAGDIDCPGSYEYDVIFRAVPGLTFEMAQAGKMTPQVDAEFRKAIQFLEAKGVSGITGDCGFMMAFQPIARQIAKVPVFMSSMVQCPLISVAFDKYDKILILTANDLTLKPQKETLLSHCGFDVDDNRFIIKGCQDVPGFDAVAKAGKVDVEFVTPGIVKLTKEMLKKVPSIRAILLECTELPPYADALRKETGLAVFDAITCADFFISARKDNPRFGLNAWQNPWDQTVDEYKLGQNLSQAERSQMQSLSS